MEKMDICKEEMLNEKVWAVIGVTPNEEKFGYKIWEILKRHGYETYGVNPKYGEVEGEKIYKSLSDIPVKPDVVDFVVPPKVTRASLEEAKKLGIEYLWFQPGTFDDEIVEKSKEMGFKIVYLDCVLATLLEKEKKE